MAECNEDEVNSLNDNSDWTLVDRPKDRKVITERWVYKIKTEEQGNIDKFTARYVAKGFMQVPGLDFYETCAPCKPETMRTLLALAAQWGLQPGHENGLFELTFDRVGLHGATRRVH